MPSNILAEQLVERLQVTRNVGQELAAIGQHSKVRLDTDVGVGASLMAVTCPEVDEARLHRSGDLDRSLTTS